MVNIKTGDNLWYIKDGKVYPFRVDFLNKESALMEDNGNFIKVGFSNLYPNKESAEQKIASNDFIAICRETSPKDGEVSVYEVNSQIDDNLIRTLELRGILNSELLYFITKKDTFEKYKDMFIKNYKYLTDRDLAVLL